MPSESTPVLIAGAGPTGLALAAALRCRGVRCVIVDPQQRSDEDSSRAVTVHAGTLEGLDAIGAAEGLLERGSRFGLFEIRQGDRILARNDFSRLRSRFNFLLSLPQRETEAALRARLEELGGAVTDGWRVEDLRQDEASVEVDLSGPDASRRTVRAGFLVGCDGAHSTVRARLDLEFTGAPYPETFVLADVEVGGPIRHDRHTMFLADEGPLLFIPLPGGRMRLGAICTGGPPEPDALETFVRGRTGSDAIQLETVDNLSVLRVHRRHARRVHVGRVFLAGDAAHVHTPMGATGMNTGIRDALDLAAVLTAAGPGPMPPGADYESSAMARAERMANMADRLQAITTSRGVERRLLVLGARALSRFPPTHDRMIASIAGLS